MLLFVTALSARGADCAGDVVLNELLPNPGGADDDAEWVELYTRARTTGSRDGWILLWGALSVASPFVFGPMDLAAGGYLVAGGSRSGADVEIVGLAMGHPPDSGDPGRVSSGA